jgi:hypothetical protein
MKDHSGSTTKFNRWNSFFVILCLFGCEAEKESLHESDHETPAHWPQSLNDAANKLEERLTSVDHQHTDVAIRNEIADLIGWSPEIAADTELKEKDWIPIYQLSETLRKHLQASDVSLNDCEEDVQRLISLLRESNATLVVSVSSEQP